MSDDSAPSGPDDPAAGNGGKSLTLHLVSHASGEMVEMIARNAVAQLDGVTVDRHLWKFVRNLGLVPGILAEIARCRGIVFHSIAATDIREALDEGCLHLRVPCIFVLEPFVSKLAECSGAPIRYHTAARDFIDEDYYQRVEAMKYTLAHDDGQAADDLEDADVILVGVSRATKTPTCMYLASRGIKAANVPVVPGVPLPDGVLKAKAPLVVGLTVQPRVLAEVRSSRLQRLAEESTTSYSEAEAVAQEVLAARRLCARHRWRTINVTNRPIESTAASILNLLKKRKEAAQAPSAPSDPA